MTTTFKIGDRVIDRSGFVGTIRNITEWRDARWYDVRFEAGEAVRFDSDLRLAEQQSGGEPMTTKPVPSHVLTGRYQGMAGLAREQGDEQKAMRLLAVADAYMTAALTGRGRKQADMLAKEV